MNNDNELLIEKFLFGELNQNEEIIFNANMAVPEFASEVMLYKQLKTAAIFEGRAELKRKLNQISNEYVKGNRQKKISFSTALKQIAYPIAASLVFLITVSYLFYYKSNYNSYEHFSKRGSISNTLTKNG